VITRHAMRRVVLAEVIAVASVLAVTSLAVGELAQSTAQTTANAKADQFHDDLRHRLDAAEGRLKSLKADLQAMRERTEKSVHEKLEEARRKLRGQKEHIAWTEATLKARALDKLTETDDTVREWKAKREVHKLNARADRAEAYAAAAIDHAVAAIDEAEEAILDAAVARLDADAAQSSAPAPR
jgi:hypothetical protein